MVEIPFVFELKKKSKKLLFEIVSPFGPVADISSYGPDATSSPFETVSLWTYASFERIEPGLAFVSESSFAPVVHIYPI